ncbi:hypothetical protein AAFF_G00286400 [Aldrovandia affinis]|uniref:Protein FAM169B n=1 Tax=Aldrovandia affinis TaxID=143900 RepID=A0AAD7TAY1_9TELE|nr:hypothetical protein AAFF_G00286400 [Aldrovandia affinis]
METSSMRVQLPEENYPVDASLLDYDILRQSADDFMACLETNSPSENNLFALPCGAKIQVTHNNIGRLSLFGDGDPSHTVLALYAPERETHVVALYLNGKWWTVNDALKTTSKSRSGLVMVRSVGERVVLFLLSQVIFRVLERPPGEGTYFTPHPAGEVAKIIWQDGEAAGFYTVKQKGTLCNSCSSLSYLLPVLDTLFVRMRFRRRGIALQMLEDFCRSYTNEEVVGISRLVSSGMYQVCRKYLQAQDQDRDRLYEVEAPGGWTQRRNVWLSIQLSHCSANTDSSLGQNLSGVESERKVTPDEVEKGLDCQNATSVESVVRMPQRNSGQKRTGKTAEEKESINSKRAKVLH